MGKTTIKKLITADSQLKRNCFQKSYYFDYLIIKILHEKGHKLKENLEGYSIYGFPKDKPQRYILCEGMSHKQKVCELTSREIILYVKEILPENEYRAWLEYNLGIMDILKPVMNQDLKDESILIKNFLEDPKANRLDKIITQREYDSGQYIRMAQKVIESKHIQVEKYMQEKADAEARLKVALEELRKAELKIIKTKRKNLEDHTQKSLIELFTKVKA